MKKQLPPSRPPRKTLPPSRRTLHPSRRTLHPRDAKELHRRHKKNKRKERSLKNKKEKLNKTELTFSNNAMLETNEKYFVDLLDIVGKNTKLESLNISNLNLGKDQLISLIRCLGYHPCLTKLYLSTSGITNSEHLRGVNQELANLILFYSQNLQVVEVEHIDTSEVPRAAANPSGINAQELTHFSRVHLIAHFHCACINGNLERMQLLLSISQEILNFTDPISKKSGLFYAAENGHENCVRFLLQHENHGNIDSCNIPDSSGWTPLLVAARYGHLPIVIQLINAGADIHAQTPQGFTTLMFATFSNTQYSADLIQYLLIKGASLNTTNQDGRTAAMFAAIRNNSSALQVLIENGANLELKDRLIRRMDQEQRRTVFDYAANGSECERILNDYRARASLENSASANDDYVGETNNSTRPNSRSRSRSKFCVIL